jgi:hypothetical protein
MDVSVEDIEIHGDLVAVVGQGRVFFYEIRPNSATGVYPQMPSKS